MSSLSCSVLGPWSKGEESTGAESGSITDHQTSLQNRPRIFLFPLLNRQPLHTLPRVPAKLLAEASGSAPVFSTKSQLSTRPPEQMSPRKHLVPSVPLSALQRSGKVTGKEVFKREGRGWRKSWGQVTNQGDSVWAQSPCNSLSPAPTCRVPAE